ncbi:MAG: DUF2281 domain-containing protein [Candidatus Aminicenantia bacterium]
MKAALEYEEILKSLKTLPAEKIEEVKDFIEFLTQKTRREKKGLFKLSGTLSSEEARLMLKSIEESCEKITYEEW